MNSTVSHEPIMAWVPTSTVVTLRRTTLIRNCTGWCFFRIIANKNAEKVFFIVFKQVKCKLTLRDRFCRIQYPSCCLSMKLRMDQVSWWWDLCLLEQSRDHHQKPRHHFCVQIQRVIFHWSLVEQHEMLNSVLQVDELTQRGREAEEASKVSTFEDRIQRSEERLRERPFDGSRSIEEWRSLKKLLTFIPNFEACQRVTNNMQILAMINKHHMLMQICLP